MKVRVSGKQIEIGEALPVKVRERLAAAIAKHFDGGADASVVFSKERYAFRADCTVHLDSGVILKSEGKHAEAHRAFDAALDIWKSSAALQAPSEKSSREGQGARPRLMA